MKRKAQGEIITTVLIILLVLAAIVIVWQAVRTTVGTASTRAETQANCIGLDLSVEASCDTSDNSLNVQVTRGGDSITGTAVMLRVSAAGGTGAGTAEVASTALGSASFDITSFLPAPGLTNVGTSVTINTGLIVTPTTGDAYSCKGSTVKITCAA